MWDPTFGGGDGGERTCAGRVRSFFVWMITCFGLCAPGVSTSFFRRNVPSLSNEPLLPISTSDITFGGGGGVTPTLGGGGGGERTCAGRVRSFFVWMITCFGLCAPGVSTSFFSRVFRRNVPSLSNEPLLPISTSDIATTTDSSGLFTLFLRRNSNLPTVDPGTAANGGWSAFWEEGNVLIQWIITVVVLFIPAKFLTKVLNILTDTNLPDIFVPLMFLYCAFNLGSKWFKSPIMKVIYEILSLVCGFASICVALVYVGIAAMSYTAWAVFGFFCVFVICKVIDAYLA